jgi:hypothetical protein
MHEHVSHLEKPSILSPQSITMRYILVSQTEKKTIKVCHEDESQKAYTESITIEPKVKHVPWVQCPFHG